jgi:hypothetical protein
MNLVDETDGQETKGVRVFRRVSVQTLDENHRRNNERSTQLPQLLEERERIERPLGQSGHTPTVENDH